MQVKAGKLLTDMESVLLASDILAGYYDEFLEKSAATGISCVEGPGYQLESVVFWGRNGYSYELDSMLALMEREIGSIYGRYNGSNQTPVRGFFFQASSFVRTVEYEQGNRVVFVQSDHQLSLFGLLPAGEWAKIERGIGFACRFEALSCVVVSFPGGKWNQVMGELCAHEEVRGALAFALHSGDLAILLVISTADEALAVFRDRPDCTLGCSFEYSYGDIRQGGSQQFVSMLKGNCIRE